MDTRITLHVPDHDMMTAIRDPFQPSIYHLETLLPFSEANKLVVGNANVRNPKSNSRPYKRMLDTVETSPRTFHVENRGIVFVCDGFDMNEHGFTVYLKNPTGDEASSKRSGIADGGHTFSVIANTMERAGELTAKFPDWTEPFVRVKFMVAGDTNIERVVEALNTSIQVREHTLDDYRNEFEPLKTALAEQGFDITNISWRENDPGIWDVREVIQRLACFLPSKPGIGPAIYKSRARALSLYSDLRADFMALLPIVRDVVFLPEFIESQFSIMERGRGRPLRVIKQMPEEFTYPSIGFTTKLKFDLAATLPIAGSFREIISLANGKAVWDMDYKSAFAANDEDFYRVLTDVLATTGAGNIGAIGSNVSYWVQCANIMLRAKSSTRAKGAGA